MLTVKTDSLKNFYNRNKTKIVVAALTVTTAGTVLMFRNQREFNKFLKEHNLMEEYYTPENSY